jgi:small-conductance mechanosensitive channel/CRP-like cAMP-binding protein
MAGLRMIEGWRSGSTRLVVPATLCLALAGMRVLWVRLAPHGPGMVDVAVGQTLVAAQWLAATWLVLRLIDVLLWNGLFARGPRRTVPAVVIGLVDGIIWLVAAVLIAETVLDLPVTGIAATSGIAIAIVGFALRDTLASLASGIALSIERPYHLGDWLELGSGAAGRVIEIGWLTTRLLTNEQTTIVVPNARLATTTFCNHGSVGYLTREQVELTLDHALSPARVERILVAAARSVPAIGAAARGPDVRVAEFGLDGIRWVVRYWVSDAGAVPDIRYALQRAILRHLHQAGIPLPYAKLDLFHRPMPPRVLAYETDLDRLLQRSELFGALPREDLATLAGKARMIRVRAGHPVVRQGEPGDSLYVIIEGVLTVVTEPGDGAARAVDTMGPGAMFGEFALLTGAPRSAEVRAQSDAVLFEIGRADLEPILQRQPELAAELGRILAERQANLARVRAMKQGTPEPIEHASEHELLHRIRAFFKL